MVRESRIVASMFITKMCQERCWRSATKCSLGKSEQEANYTREQLLHNFFSVEHNPRHGSRHSSSRWECAIIVTAAACTFRTLPNMAVLTRQDGDDGAHQLSTRRIIGVIPPLSLDTHYEL